MMERLNKLFTGGHGAIKLRRRSSDWQVYVLTTFAGVVGGMYVFMEPLRQLQLERMEGAEAGPAGAPGAAGAAAGAAKPAPPPVKAE